LSGSLSIRNRQRALPVNTRVLRRITLRALELLGGGAWDLGICLLGPREMARLNEQFLRHSGVTDVITFDYGPAPARQAEIFICPDEARRQARQFRTTWQGELARYVVHGLLHLAGYDDRKPADRRRMKLEENRLVREVTRACPVPELRRSSRPPGRPSKNTRPGRRPGSSLI